MVGISIIIVNYNSSKYTINCIESLIKYEKMLFEVIIVDNDSKVKDKELLKEYLYSFNKNDLDYKLILNDLNYGFGQANNIGVKKAKYKFILLLNTDTLFKKDVLKELIDEFKNNTHIGIIGVQLLNFDETLQASYGYFPSIKQEVFELFPKTFKKKYENVTQPLALTLNKNEKKKIVDYVSGAFILVKKDLYLKVKGFNKDFFMYFEETDFCRRVINNGYKVLIMNTNAVKHKGGGSIGAFSINKAKAFKKGKLLYLKKYSNKYKTIMVVSKINSFVKMIAYNNFINNNKDSKEKSLYWRFMCLGK